MQVADTKLLTLVTRSKMEASGVKNLQGFRQVFEE